MYCRAGGYGCLPGCNRLPALIMPNFSEQEQLSKQLDEQSVTPPGNLPFLYTSFNVLFSVVMGIMNFIPIWILFSLPGSGLKRCGASIILPSAGNR